MYEKNMFYCSCGGTKAGTKGRGVSWQLRKMGLGNHRSRDGGGEEADVGERWDRAGCPGDISALLQECLNVAQFLGNFITSSGHMASCRKLLFSTQYFI